MGAVAFRASLEVSEHPRTSKISSWIPEWLEKLGVAEELDPLEREILITPYGQLDKSQRIDANWSGEGAALFCWALNIGEQPPLLQNADQGEVISTLRVMQPEASELLSAPTLRCDRELEEYCKTVLLVRLMLREAHVGERDLGAQVRQQATSIGRKLVRRNLADFGIEVGDSDFETTHQLVANVSPEQRRSAAGAYVARDIAVTWLFDSRSIYFDDDRQVEGD